MLRERIGSADTLCNGKNKGKMSRTKLFFIVQGHLRDVIFFHPEIENDLAKRGLTFHPKKFYVVLFEIHKRSRTPTVKQAEMIVKANEISLPTKEDLLSLPAFFSLGLSLMLPLPSPCDILQL